MIRHRRVLIGYLLGIIVAAVIGTILIGWERSMTLVMPTPAPEDIDFAALRPADAPNRFLVCPENYCAAPPDRISPVFDMPVAALRDRWQQMLQRHPRITQARADETGLQHDFVQRSRFFRFPDSITVRFIPLPENRSTLAVYSRSRYGRDDFGVNRERIEAWLAALSG
ncbi:MAG: DUF1499 domain-containing protein [Alphaproteobacteria bacterium]